MKVEFCIPSSVNSKSYYFQMPNYCLICLKRTCVLENGNYSEPRVEVESKSEWDTRVHWTHLFTKKTGLRPLHSGLCPSHYFWQTVKEDHNCFSPRGVEMNYMKETLNKGCLSACDYFLKGGNRQNTSKLSFQKCLVSFYKTYN